MGYKADQRLPSEIHDEYIAALQESAEEPLPPYTPSPNSGEAVLSSSPEAGNDYEGTPSIMSVQPPSPSAQASTSASASASAFSLPHYHGSGGSAPRLPPRSASTESITPSSTTQSPPSDGRRILLLIYIHGFVGDETTFGAFPAHVHALLTRRLAASHAVHTKVYPRYKTRSNIGVVRDRFSTWLVEREGPATDIVLLGHSMGGILAAEVALMPEGAGAGAAGFGVPMGVGRKHRILGTLNLDVPFLGMHPKIIGAGISSLFTGNPEKAQGQGGQALGEGGSASESTEQIAFMPIEPVESLTSASTSMTSLSRPSLEVPSVGDEHFNPTYANDTRVPTRKAFDNIAHFIGKHAKSDGILKAGTNYVTSHLEFGGTMADYRRLDRRYKMLRALEQEPDSVRFVNYFTTCEGRPKAEKPKKPKPKNLKSGTGKAKEEAGQVMPQLESTARSEDDLIELDNVNQDQEQRPSLDEEDMAELTLTLSDPIPVSESDAESGNYTPSTEGSFQDAQENVVDKEEAKDEESIATRASSEQQQADLPPLPPEPIAPPAFDVSKYTDADALKAAEKLHSLQLKAYQRAYKDHNKLVIERQKILRKREEKRQKDEKKAEQETLKQTKAQEKVVAKAEQKKRADEKEAEKEKQKKLKALEKEAAREKKEADKAEKLRLKQQQKEEKEALKRAKAQAKENATGAVDEDDDGGNDDQDDDDEEEEEAGDVEPTRLKKRKLKTFCLTPPKATAARRKDWIPVFVANSDQVAAHCGLFKEDKPHYQPFVERVVERIEDWVDDLPDHTA